MKAWDRGEGNIEELGTASTAGAAAGGLTASAHK